MSFVNAIRDYTETLNTLSDSVNFSVFDLTKTTVLYFINSIIFVVLYVFSFQWIKDLSHLPVLLPTVNAKILNEYYVLENHFNFIEMGPVSSLESNKLVVGFLNAFFLALPFSVPQLISIRRWLIQGSVAGVASVIGFRIGQTFFFAAILLGFRFLVLPWFSYEPLTYLIGLLLLVNLIYEMTHENLVTIPSSQVSRLLQIFAVHFAFAWTEQSAIFNYFSNNSFSTNFTNLDIFVTSQNSEFWVSHLVYIVGLFVGGLFFDFLFLLGISHLLESCQIWFKVPLSSWKKQSNSWFLRISLALSFASIPYYTLDYLLLGPVGFVSQDKAIIQGTDMLFSKNKLDYMRLDQEKEMFLDPFNRNILLQTGPEGLEESIFETRNFEGERAWSIQSLKKASVTDASSTTKSLARRFFSSLSIQKDSALEEKAEVLKPKPSDVSNLNGKEPEREFFSKALDYNVDEKDFNVSFYNRLTQDYSPNLASVPNSENQDELFNLLHYYFPTFLNENVKFQSRPEAIIKTKFYSNPIYKNLLSVYVDSILQQQPEDYRMSKEQEQNLYQARLALEEYYNGLREYAKLSYYQQFNETFGGTKGYSNKVYNQQFKGNLKIVRRLFGVSWDPEENPTGLRKVSFDQTLYESTPAKFYHEEIGAPRSKTTGPRANPLPFYAGWDNDLRKFVVSNRYLSRPEVNLMGVSAFASETDVSAPANPYTQLKAKNAFVKNLQNPDSSFTTKAFSSWPILYSNAKETDSFLFETGESLKSNKELLEMLQFSPENRLLNEKLPLSVNFASASKKPILPPFRGGFIWPGENELNFQKLVK